MPQTINETFLRTVCINLDRRPDRWQRMQREFAQHRIEPVQRFSACDGKALMLPANWNHTAGAYGCLLSHLQVVQDARGLAAPSVLIFEDDAVFAPDLQAKFAVFIEEVPPDWDMLYFGALHKDEPEKIREHVYRITRANSTYAYALRRTIFDDFIELNRRAEHVLDMNAYKLQERFNCYCFMPNLAWVQSEYSDVQNRLERHWYLEQSLVLFGARIDRLLRETAIVFAHSSDTANAQATENLMFLARYYHEFFAPLIQIVVVEQGARATINPALMPPDCRYIFLKCAGPFDREQCFQAGISDRKFYLLTDSDLYLETLDMRANLRMCETHDGTTGFSKIIDLTPEQAALLRQTGITRGIDVTQANSEHDARGQCRFIRRDAFERSSQIRIFQSPNHALRLPR